MKKILSFLLLAVLCGCGQRTEHRIKQLENKVTALEIELNDHRLDLNLLNEIADSQLTNWNAVVTTQIVQIAELRRSVTRLQNQK